MAELIGKQLGNYRLIRRLGHGGFGDVYLGQHVHLQRHAAIKVLHAHMMQWREEAFREEAQRLVDLEYPHIVRIFDFGIEAGTSYLVMEYAPNGSLRERHPSGSRLPLDTIVPYVKHIAAALQYVHERKLIHRDIKPANILLGSKNNLLLSDVGLAIVSHGADSFSQQQIAGTPAYMAPEQAQGMAIPASDQYSLGVMVYEWLCGELPFHGGPVELMGQHTLTPPPSLLSKVPGLPSAVEAVVFKALAKDSQERFASVEAFASAFEATWRGNAPLQSSSLATLSLSVQPHNASAARPMNNSVLSAGISLDKQEQLPTELHTPVMPFQEARAWLSLSSPPSVSGDIQPVQSGALTSQPEAITGPSPLTGATLLQAPASKGESGPTADMAGDREAGLPPQTASSSQPTGPATPLPLVPTPARAPEKAHRRGKRLWLLASLLFIVLLASILASLNFTYPGGLASLLRSSQTPDASSSHGSSGKNGTGVTSVTVTIVPISKDLKQAYTIVAVTGTPDAAQQQVQARILSSTSPAQSKTVITTGMKTTSAKHATGTLFISYNGGNGNTLDFNAGTTFHDFNPPNIDVVTDASVSVPAGGTSSVPVHVVQAGTIGNVPSYTGDSSKGFINVQNGQGGWNAYNEAAFTGGQDQQSSAAVAQSDIDNATSSLVSSVTPGVQTAVRSQVAASERSVSNPQCSHTVKANHQAGDQATSVTVTVVVTCTLESYDYNEALALASQLLHQQATHNPGTGYVLVGRQTTTLTQTNIADANIGTIDLDITSEGLWAYSFTAPQQQAFKTYMAGKQKTAMLAWLLSQNGVSQASIQISDGDGNTLPSDPNAFVIAIQTVQGA